MEEYVENEVLVVSNLMNGPKCIGDLWDCHTSRTIDANVFDGRSNNQYITTENINRTKYSIRKLETPIAYFEEDQGELALELATGIIEDNLCISRGMDNLYFGVDVTLYLCEYKKELYHQKYLPSDNSVLNQEIISQIKCGQLSATHVALEIYSGAKINAFIKSKLRDSSSPSCDECEVFEYGPLNLYLQEKLELNLDTPLIENDISILSNFKELQVPGTVHEMFSTIQLMQQEFINMESDIQKSFPPVYVLLYPLNHLFDFKVHCIYRRIPPTVLQSLKTMLQINHDLQRDGYSSNLQRFKIQARYSVEEIKSTEIETRQAAKVFYFTFVDIWKKFKIGQLDQEDLESLVIEFDSAFSMKYLLPEKIGTGNEEISMNTNDEEIYWLNTMENFEYQIILICQPDFPIRKFIPLYKLSILMSSVGLVFGIHVSETLREVIKIRTNFENETTYSTEYIPIISDIISFCCFSKNSSLLSTKIFELESACHGIPLPFKISQDWNVLIDIFRPSYGCRIAETCQETKRLIHGQPQGWKLIFPIESIGTAKEAVQKARTLKSDFPHDSEIIFGSFGLENVIEAPILLAFKKGVLEAICFDIVDILIFIDINNTDMKGTDFSVLSPKNMTKNCFYTQAMQSAIKISNDISFLPDQRIDLYDLETPFDQNQDEFSHHCLELVCTALTSVEIRVANSMAKLLVSVDETILPILIEHGYHASTQEFSIETTSRSTWNTLNDVLFQHLQNLSPFLAKLESAVVFNSTELLGLNIIENISSDVNCPEDLKTDLLAFESDSVNELTNFQKNAFTLIAKLIEQESDKNLVYLIRFLNYTVYMCTAKKFVGISLAERFIKKLIFTGLKEKLTDEILRNLIDKNYYQLAHLLRKSDVSEKLFLVQQALDQLVSLEDSSTLIILIKQMSEQKFTEEHYRYIWTNPRFQYLMGKATQDENVVQYITIYQCRESVPQHLPSILLERLTPFVGEEFDLNWNDFDTTLQFFEKIVLSQVVPPNLTLMLLRRIEIESIKSGLVKCNALFYWNEDEKCFNETWTLQTVKDALNAMISWRDRHQITLNQSNSIASVEFELGVEEGFGNTTRNILKLKKFPEPVLEKWRNFAGDTLDFILPADFMQIRSLIKKPKLSDPKNCYPHLYLYILQRLRMLGCHAINPDHISKLIEQEDEQSNSIRSVKMDFGSQLRMMKKCQINEQKVENNIPTISRLDFLSCLFYSCHPIVIQDILGIMSQFSIGLPLVIPDITSPNKFISLIPLLQTSSIKWESRPGVIAQNNFFANPYKLTVALRIGTRLKLPGKSTILNQLMQKKHVFTSYADSGAKRGIPIGLYGFVEFIPLTKESCSETLWSYKPNFKEKTENNSQQQQYSIKEHYSSGSKRALFLANLHGDALQFPETLRFLSQISSNYIIFFMPDSLDTMSDKLTELSDIIGSGDNIIHVMVDPGPEYDSIVPEEINISTARLTEEDTTLSKLRYILYRAINSNSEGPNSDPAVFKMIPTPSIRPAQNIFTNESKRLIDFIKENTCKVIKGNMQLQRRSLSNLESYIEIWRNNEILRTISEMFIQILKLELEDRRIALAHFDREVSILSIDESTDCRRLIRDKKEELRRAIQFENNNQTMIKRYQSHIKKLYIELDKTSLGLEHFYREIGRIFEIAQCNILNTKNKLLRNFLPNTYADLLLDGSAIEILDGDKGEINSAWFYSVTHKVCERFVSKELRIFVVSILGVQSSGKSTLLNALFGCKFAVSMGRCTRGLFMRLLFLEESLKEELGIDALLLIDSEGLGAPEKMNDKDIEKKDRQMATFAMSVSHLTLINTKGESISELADILQIVIVTMARLETAGMSPDILMVQHLPERDTDKTNAGVDEFCKALQAAIEMTDKNDIDIGARGGKNLANLMNRVQNGQILKQFRPYKHGASTNAPPSEEYHEDIIDLYETILKTIRDTKTNINFHKWHELLLSYWNSVSKEGFSLRFKSINEIYEFIERGGKIAKFKEAVDSAFRIHREEIEANIRNTMQQVGIQNISNGISESSKQEIIDQLKYIPSSCPKNEDGSFIHCIHCKKASDLENSLLQFVENTNTMMETEITIKTYVKNIKEIVLQQIMQTIHAVQVTQVCIVDFDKIINGILKQKLDGNQSNSIEERQQIENEIWQKLKAEVSAKSEQQCVQRKIEDEVRVQYEHNIVVKNQLKSKLPILLEIPAFLKPMRWRKYPVKRFLSTFKPMPGVEKAYEVFEYYCDTDSTIYEDEVGMGVETRYLLPNLADTLNVELSVLPHTILQKFNVDHFDVGMIRELYNSINLVLENFERKFALKLITNFKWQAHVYAIKQFITTMSKVQDNWDKINQPLGILINKEETYREKIRVRLEFGYSFSAEGQIVADLLFRGINQRAKKDGDLANVAEVSDEPWIISSENVRLHYFSELAFEVKNGMKERALQHFECPDLSIKKWFINQVNNRNGNNNGLERYTNTYNNEYDRVLQDIRNQQNCLEIKSFVETYLSRVEGIEYNCEIINIETTSINDFKLFQNSIESVLMDKRRNFPNNINLEKPSENETIMRRLGCIESCFWCSALCWGELGHEKNRDNTHKHHTCHQPEGLAGTSHTFSKRLWTNVCDMNSDKSIVYPNGPKGPCISWNEVKRNEVFSTWMYTTHNNTKFNRLMRWFFIQLNLDIAKRYKLKPATDKDMTQAGFENLNSELDEILAEIKTRIS